MQELPKVRIKEIFAQHLNFRTMPSSDFGRGSVNIQNLGKLLKIRESEKFKSMTARMPCLITIARMNSESEVSQLIDVVNGLKISKKYLITYMETLNATLLNKKAINFNVNIHHNDRGESVSGHVVYMYRA